MTEDQIVALIFKTATGGGIGYFFYRIASPVARIIESRTQNIRAKDVARAEDALERLNGKLLDKIVAGLADSVAMQRVIDGRIEHKQRNEDNVRLLAVQRHEKLRNDFDTHVTEAEKRVDFLALELTRQASEQSHLVRAIEKLEEALDQWKEFAAKNNEVIRQNNQLIQEFWHTKNGGK